MTLCNRTFDAALRLLNKCFLVSYLMSQTDYWHEREAFQQIYLCSLRNSLLDFGEKNAAAAHRWSVESQLNLVSWLITDVQIHELDTLCRMFLIVNKSHEKTWTGTFVACRTHLSPPPLPLYLQQMDTVVFNQAATNHNFQSQLIWRVFSRLIVLSKRCQKIVKNVRSDLFFSIDRLWHRKASYAHVREAASSKSLSFFA